MFTLEEIKKHNTENDCWIVIHDKVYDVSKFLDQVCLAFDSSIYLNFSILVVIFQFLKTEVGTLQRHLRTSDTLKELGVSCKNIVSVL